MSRLSRTDIAHRIAADIPDSSFVNLGIGLPTLIADRIPDGVEVILHSENGLLNIGRRPPGGQEDWDLVDAGKEPVSMRLGGSFFDSSLSFVMMRGGHLDYSILGAYEVSESGDLANWSMGKGDELPAVGGAMDLAVGAREVWVMMEHTTKRGSPRIVRHCSLPLTAPNVVKRIYTDIAVIHVTERGLVLRQMVEGLSLDEIQQMTGARLIVEESLRFMIPTNRSLS